MNKIIFEGNIFDLRDLFPHKQKNAIYFMNEPFDMIKHTDEIQAYKNKFGTKRLEINRKTGDYTVTQREAENV